MHGADKAGAGAGVVADDILPVLDRRPGKDLFQRPRFEGHLEKLKVPVRHGDVPPRSSVQPPEHEAKRKSHVSLGVLQDPKDGISQGPLKCIDQAPVRSRRAGRQPRCVGADL